MTAVKVAFFVVVQLLALVSLWYVPYRIAPLFDLKKRWPRHVASLLLLAALATCLGAFSRATGVLLLVAAPVAGALVGMHVYLALLLVLLDGLRPLLRIPRRAGTWAAIGIAGGLTAVGLFQARVFRVTTTEIPIAGLARDVTLVHISDVHLGHQRGAAYLERIVRATNRFKPDLVLLNGDLVEANSALEPGVLSALGKIEAPAYFTTGNHESYVSTRRALAAIASHGVRLLHNEVVEAHGLQIIGLDYMNADNKTFDPHKVGKRNIKEELPKIATEPGRPVLLVHHSPVGLDYVAERGVALMISGHTHGGQMFPATLAQPLFFPIGTGLHIRRGVQIFVSQGAGTYGPPLRLGTRNEINLIRLVPKR